MPHYKSFFDPGSFIEACDLDGRDITVEISGVSQGKVGRGKQESKKPVISFAGKKKQLACNKTNGKIIAALYGSDVAKWKGRLITLYPTTTQFGGETVECVRVRNFVPQKGAKADKTPEPESSSDDDDVPDLSVDEPGSGEP
jgi:hypothetical protein